MTEIEFTVYGEPMGKQRQRFSRMGNYVRAYTPEKTTNYEGLVGYTYGETVVDKMKEEPNFIGIFEGAIGVEIKAYLSIPESTSKKKKLQMLDNSIRPQKKPDADNIAKIILDGLNKVAFKDDSQIVSLHVSKYYGERPRCDIRIYTINE